VRKVQRHIRLTLLCLFIPLAFCFAQENPVHRKKNLKLAEDAFERMNYLKAYELYSDIIKYDTSNYDAAFKAGFCLFAVNKTDTNCLRYFNRTKTRIPEAHFYIGRVMLLEDRVRVALEEFYQFKSLNDEKTIINLEVLHWINTCETALKEENKQQTLIVRNLGEQINTKYSEYVPLVWNVNGALVFTSRREDSKGGLKDPYGKFYEDVYIAQNNGSGWSNPASIGDNINTNNHDACVAFSPSGNELLIYRTDEKQTGGDLYICTYDGTKWSDPQILGPEINSPYLETSACFSSTGNEIIFSSNRPGGLGGRDLYITRKFMNGKYSLPRNLGSNINSGEDEDAPFIDKNTNNLYFSSKGHNSMGEYDIFMAEFDENLDQWNMAQNIGAPINSTNDDIYFIKLDDKDEALFTSRREGGYGDADIYKVNFGESSQITLRCKLNTIDKTVDTKNLKDVQLSLYDYDTGKLEGLFRPNREYMTLILIADIEKEYRIIIEGTGIEPITEKVTFTGKEKELNFDLMMKNK
jgi:hypothetical protein